MKFSLVTVFLVCSVTSSSAFVKSFAPTSNVGGDRATPAILKGTMSDEVGIPCEEECALESFPGLPESIHPGVLSGQAMMDLLQHAKDNGKRKTKMQNKPGLAKNNDQSLFCLAQSTFTYFFFL